MRQTDLYVGERIFLAVISSQRKRSTHKDNKAFFISDPSRKFVFWIAIAVLLAGNLIQLTTFINHDVGWVLYSSGRLLDGGTFGREIIAANPPLIWWISAIPNAVARLTGLGALVVFRIGVLCLSVLVVIDLYRKLSEKTPALMFAGILILFAAFVGYGANRDFGQREHLAVILCVPYLVRAAELIDTGGTSNRTNWLASIGAGIGVAFKPHFVLIPIFVELFVALRLRSAKHLFRADLLVSTATIAAYILAVLVFARPYITEVIPSVREVYWGFGWPVGHVIWVNFEIVSLVVLAFAIVSLNRFPALATTTCLAAVGFLGAALLQKKGYSYHLYPASAFALVALVSTLSSAHRHLRATSALVLGLAVIYLGQTAYLENRKRGAEGIYGREVQAVIDVVQEHVPEGGNFLAISTHPFPGFPVTNYAARDWLAASNSRIGLPAIVRLRAGGITASQSDLLKRVEQREQRAMLLDLSHNPDIVLVHVAARRHAIGNSDFDFLSFYLEDPDIRKVWEEYVEIDAGLENFRSFKRKRSEES